MLDDAHITSQFEQVQPRYIFGSKYSSRVNKIADHMLLGASLKLERLGRGHNGNRARVASTRCKQSRINGNDVVYHSPMK